MNETLKIVSVKEAAKLTGLSCWELSCGARSGKYPAMKIGGSRGKWAFDLDILQKRLVELMYENMEKCNNSESKIPKIS